MLAANLNGLLNGNLKPVGFLCSCFIDIVSFEKQSQVIDVSFEGMHVRNWM